MLKQLAENCETGVQSPVFAKCLTPEFSLINHFYEMIISIWIDCCAEAWLKKYLSSKKIKDFKTQLSVKRAVLSQQYNLIHLI